MPELELEIKTWAFEHILKKLDELRILQKNKKNLKEVLPKYPVPNPV